MLYTDKDEDDENDRDWSWDENDRDWIYVDDRTITTSTLQSMVKITKWWYECGRQNGLKENRDKTQFFTMMKGKQRKKAEEELKTHFADSKWHPAPKVLGVVLTTSARATHMEENKRLQKAVARIKLISSLNLPLDRYRTMVKIFAIPMANYGWAHRKISKGIAQSINGAIAG